MTPTRFRFTRENGKWAVRRGGESTVKEYETLPGAIRQTLTLEEDRLLVFSHCGGMINFEVFARVVRIKDSEPKLEAELFAEKNSGSVLQVSLWLARMLSEKLYN